MKGENNKLLTDKENQLTETDSQLKNSNKLLAEKDNQLDENVKLLTKKDKQLNQKDEELEMRKREWDDVIAENKQLGENWIIKNSSL